MYKFYIIFVKVCNDKTSKVTKFKPGRSSHLKKYLKSMQF